jgi:hypothetical protein
VSGRCAGAAGVARGRRLRGSRSSERRMRAFGPSWRTRLSPPPQMRRCADAVHAAPWRHAHLRIVAEGIRDRDAGDVVRLGDALLRLVCARCRARSSAALRRAGTCARGPGRARSRASACSRDRRACVGRPRDGEWRRRRRSSWRPR